MPILPNLGFRKECISVMANTPFERAIEKMTGESVDSLREMPIDGWRQIIEDKHKKPMLFVSLFPLIGRGNVLGRRTLSRQEIEDKLDKVLS